MKLNQEADDHRFMVAAMEEAQSALAHDDVPVGAVVVKDGVIVGLGHNEREKQKSPVAHAEVLALVDAAKRLGHWNLSGCSLYVTLEPCPMCAGALVNSRIKELVFAAHDPKAGVVSLGIDILNNTRLNHRVNSRQGPLAKECGALLSDFFRGKRKKAQETF
jgi:tRNA(adenine34) deaminase